jgi:excisionase family DNA binding protein
MTEIKLLTVDEIATILRVSKVFVRRLLREGKIKGRKVGRDWRVEETELQRYIRDTTQGS